VFVCVGHHRRWLSYRARGVSATNSVIHYGSV
jgi:hypothetical protein